MTCHLELKRRGDLVPVSVEDLKEPLVYMFVEDEHANPGAQQHRLDDILRHAALFAVKDCVMGLFNQEELLAISLLPRRRRPPESGIGNHACRFDLLDALRDHGPDRPI
jgi:hypothetical protein